LAICKLKYKGLFVNILGKPWPDGIMDLKSDLHDCVG
jgi:hypothetical protein